MARITVEDSLRVAKTRFGLVSLASKRARQLLKGSAPLMESKNREIVLALREIAAGKVVYAHPEYLNGTKKISNQFRIILSSSAMKNISNKTAINKLIFALDADSYEEALSWIELLSGHVGMFKVGKELFTSVGPKIVESIKQRDQTGFLGSQIS